MSYKSNEAFELGDGIIIPKDTEMVLGVLNILKDPNQWQKPEEFNPDRFDPFHPLSKTPEGKRRLSSAFCPFSMGKRSCPGRSLVMLELKVFVIFLLENMEWEISQD